MSKPLSHDEKGDLLFKEMAAAALNASLNKGWFDITSLDKVAKMSDDYTYNFTKSKNYAALRALHCVDWSAMTPEVKSSVSAMIQHLVEPFVGKMERTTRVNAGGIPYFETNYVNRASGDSNVGVLESPETPGRPKNFWQRLRDKFSFEL